MKDTEVCFLAAILAAFVLFCVPAAAEDLPDAEPRGGGGGGMDAGSPVWQVLSKSNFSSQIRFHPHVLVMVTVPCKSSLLPLSLSSLARSPIR